MPGSPTRPARAAASSSRSMPTPRAPRADYIDHLRGRGAAPSRFAGIPVSIKDLFDIAGDVTTSASVALRDAAPAAARRGRGRAAARRRPDPDRPHQHDRVRLLRPRHQPALRHAAQSVRPRNRPHPRRIVLRGRGVGDGRHGGRSRSAPTPAARAAFRRRCAASSATSRRRSASRSTACCRCRSRSIRSARSRRPSPAARRSTPSWPASTLRRSRRSRCAACGSRRRRPWCSTTSTATCRGAMRRRSRALSAAGAVITDIALSELKEIATLNARGGFAASEAYAWHRRLIEAKGAALRPPGADAHRPRPRHRCRRLYRPRPRSRRPDPPRRRDHPRLRRAGDADGAARRPAARRTGSRGPLPQGQSAGAAQSDGRQHARPLRHLAALPSPRRGAGRD